MRKLFSTILVLIIFASWSVAITQASVLIQTTGGKNHRIGTVNSGPTGGLTAWWTFDAAQMTGTKALDKSTSGFTGTLGGTTRLPGKLNQALNFNGTSDNVDVSSAVATHKLYTANTVSAWFFATPGVDTGTILSLGSPVSVSPTYWSLDVPAADPGGVRIRIFSEPTLLLSAITANLEMKRWIHVAFKGDSTGNAMYINGQKVSLTYSNGSATTDGSFSTANGPDSLTSEFIGELMSNGTGSNYATGRIDDVRVYNRSLSDNEIYSLYKYGSASHVVNSQAVANQAATNGLIGHWTLNGADVVTKSVLDRSGSGYHAPIAAGVLATAKAVPGKIGQGFKYITTNDVVQTTQTLFSTANAVSVSFWVKTRINLGAAQVMHLMGRDSATASARTWQLRFANANEDLEWLRFDASGTFAETVSVAAPDIEDGLWHLITTTFNTTAGSRIYIDGVQRGSSSNTTAFNDDAPLCLGCDPRGASTLVDGVFDEVRLYNRALTANEVYNLYLYGR